MAGIFLAGLGIAWLGGLISLWCSGLAERAPSVRWSTRGLRWGAVAATLILAVGATLVAIPKLYSYDQLNASDIAAQRAGEAIQGAQIAPMLDLIRQANNGRVYAGLPTNWGAHFYVGYVPVFEYLTAEDIQGVGFTLRTASLMSQPEAQFNEYNASDYALYGVRYLILPRVMPSPVPAVQVETSGPYRLWAIPQNSFFSIVVPSGVIHANKATLARQAPLIQGTGYFAHHIDYRVIYPSSSVAVTDPTVTLSASPGKVLSEEADLLHGRATARVTLSRPANVVLSASFDPGWTATVDGHSVATQMLAPAVVSVPVPVGIHTVSFTYVGFGWYPELFVLSAAGLWATWLVARRTRRRGSDSPAAERNGSAPIAPAALEVR